MKKLLLAVISLLAFMPFVVNAETRAQDLLETFERAGITPSINDYEETEDQVMLYLFWGETCPRCHEELEFINSILKDYKDKIKLRSYEGSIEDNYLLQQKVAKHFEIDAPGVPLLVVGENTFYGFKDEVGEKIKIAIDREYKKSERYDMFAEMEKKRKEGNSNVPLYIFGGLLSIIIVVSIIFLARKE